MSELAGRPAAYDLFSQPGSQFEATIIAAIRLMNTLSPFGNDYSAIFYEEI